MENKITVSGRMLYIAILPVLIFSNVISILFHGSSMRLGLTVGMVLIILVHLYVFKSIIFNIYKQYTALIFYFLILVLLLYMISFTIYDTSDVKRFFLSYIFIFGMFIVVILFMNIINRSRDINFNQVIFIAFWILLIAGIISAYLISNQLVARKPMILFSEPSHYALVYSPLLLYTTYSKYINGNKSQVLMYLLITLIIIISVKNLTMLAGFLIVVFLLYANRLKFWFICIFLLIIMFYLAIDLSYFSNRLNLSFESTNSSVLVFLSGWERAYLSVIDSYGIGLGFQQIGYVGPSGELLEKVSGLNFNDGGTLGAKIIAELGLFGLLILIVYLVALYFIVKKIVCKELDASKDIFFYSAFIMMSLTFFVRGAGYFTPSSFMFIASIYWIYIKGEQYFAKK